MSKPPVRVRQQHAPAGEVRIIGGQWKRSKLPVADKPGLRPTPDRVRETLFNWLGQDLTGWHLLRCCGVLGCGCAVASGVGRRLVSDFFLEEAKHVWGVSRISPFYENPHTTFPLRNLCQTRH